MFRVFVLVNGANALIPRASFAVNEDLSILVCNCKARFIDRGTSQRQILSVYGDSIGVNLRHTMLGNAITIESRNAIFGGGIIYVTGQLLANGITISRA